MSDAASMERELGSEEVLVDAVEVVVAAAPSDTQALCIDEDGATMGGASVNTAMYQYCEERSEFRLESDGMQGSSTIPDAEEDVCGDVASGLYMLRLRSTDSQPVMIYVTVADRQLPMLVDTGSPISCISEDVYMRLFNDKESLKRNDIRLKGYDGKRIRSLGYFFVFVSCGNISKKLKLYAIRDGGCAILGRDWLKALNINIKVVNSILTTSNERYDPEWFVNEYPSVFRSKSGKVTLERATLRLCAGAVPVYRNAGYLPLELRPRVDAELRRMETAGIISRVASSDWASCLVVTLKNDGTLRLSGDYKSTVNPSLERNKFPLPHVECLMNKLSGGKRFTKLDLSEIYSQIELDETKLVTAINTHRGLYVYNRLVCRLASVPSIFQGIIERLFVGIPQVACFLDDILITGLNDEEHVENLHTVLRKLSSAGLTIRKEKCTFFSKELSFSGFVISKNGVQTDQTKIGTVLKAARPTNKTELKSFVGMVNFYCNLIASFSRLLKPLYDLLRNDSVWMWEDEHDQAFNDVKRALTQSPIVVHYKETLPLILSCDASGGGLVAALAHETARGDRTLSYASRSLTRAEASYTRLELDALAIVFAVKNFHSHLYKRKFILRTNRRSLLTMFESKDIPYSPARRIADWAILLSGYNFDIQYVSSSFNMANALSQLRLDTVEFK